jgi:hypothetical protein
VTSVNEEQREGSCPAVMHAPESNAVAGARARKDTALPSRTALEPVTERARTAGKAVAIRTGTAAARTADYLDRPASLAHAQPPTLARARELHHEAAARHDVPLLRFLRLAWGYFHLVFVKSVLNGLEWVTETPLRFAAAVTVAAVVYFWS